MSQAAPAQAPGATPRWFAIWTRSRHERAVFDQLTERGIEAFLPTTPRWSRWKDRTKKIDWPLFPGYCFARFAPASRLPVLKCAGVVSIVSFNGELAPVPDTHLREPWRMPADLQREVGCVIGVDYPEPIVDRRQAREDALERYRS